MRRVTEPLLACGAQFLSREGGRLPLAIRGARDAMPIEYRLPVASAQVKSALLLAGLNAPGWTRVEEPEPTRDHTERMLRHFGATVVVDQLGRGRVASLKGQPELRAADVSVPGDPSSAAFVLVAAAIVPGSHVTVRNVALNPARTGLFDSLREMGADLQILNARTQAGESVGDLTMSHAGLRGIDVPASRAPSMIDEYPVLAVAAACADGVTRMHGLAELRVKESDRLAATTSLLRANGVRAEVEGDTLCVFGQGAPQGGGLVETHMDHRIAMSALILGLATREPVRVDDSGFINTSFPGFASLMQELGAQIE
jgi:3-phosphoshikimate 1-carboxyvinyltransferase